MKKSIIITKRGSNNGKSIIITKKPVQKLQPASPYSKTAGYLVMNKNKKTTKAKKGKKK